MVPCRRFYCTLISCRCVPTNCTIGLIFPHAIPPCSHLSSSTCVFAAPISCHSTMFTTHQLELCFYLSRSVAVYGSIPLYFSSHFSFDAGPTHYRLLHAELFQALRTPSPAPSGAKPLAVLPAGPSEEFFGCPAGRFNNVSAIVAFLPLLKTLTPLGPGSLHVLAAVAFLF